MRAQHLTRRVTSLRERERKTVTDVAADELDVRVFGGAVKPCDTQLAQTELARSRNPVVAVDYG